MNLLRSLFVAGLTLLCGSCWEAPYDLIVSGGQVLDGNGGQAGRADVEVRGGKIVKAAVPGRNTVRDRQRRHDPGERPPHRSLGGPCRVWTG
jgi:hypothetical protein